MAAAARNAKERILRQDIHDNRDSLESFCTILLILSNKRLKHAR